MLSTITIPSSSTTTYPSKQTFAKMTEPGIFAILLAWIFWGFTTSITDSKKGMGLSEFKGTSFKYSAVRFKESVIKEKGLSFSSFCSFSISIILLGICVFYYVNLLPVKIATFSFFQIITGINMVGTICIIIDKGKNFFS